MTPSDPDRTRKRFLLWIVTTVLLVACVAARFATAPSYDRVVGLRVEDLLTAALVALGVAFPAVTYRWLRSLFPKREPRITVRELRRRANGRR